VKTDLTEVNPGTVAAVATAGVIAMVVLLSGCGRSSEASAPPASGSTGAISNPPPSEATVELLPGQLNAIKIEPAGTYDFSVEKDAVGSISLDEDPAVVQAESTLIGAAATYDLTSKELARVNGLGETNGIAQKEMEQATADEQTAGAALKAARDAVRVLGRTDAEIDQMVATGKMSSATGGRKWAVANIAESDSPLTKVGQPVDVRLTARPDRVFEGRISEIYTTVDPNTHRMMVRCEVDDPGDELRVGMLASFVVHIQAPVAATAIPANGVVREGDGTMTAWVTVDRHRFTQRIIETGMRENGQVEILKGLQRGELVVTDGAIFLDNMLQAPADD
jgi:cobalt-zinc-cadmium efflux system membrane fusion protein